MEEQLRQRCLSSICITDTTTFFDFLRKCSFIFEDCWFHHVPRRDSFFEKVEEFFLSVQEWQTKRDLIDNKDALFIRGTANIAIDHQIDDKWTKTLLVILLNAIVVQRALFIMDENMKQRGHDLCQIALDAHTRDGVPSCFSEEQYAKITLVRYMLKTLQCKTLEYQEMLPYFVSIATGENIAYYHGSQLLCL